jgi:hypothetical protein
VADIDAEATIAITIPPNEQEDLRWYMEDCLE